MNVRRIIILFLVVFCIPVAGFAAVTDYLILQDIGPYKLEGQQKVIGGYIGGPRTFGGAGVLAPTGHFYPDHTDKTYEAYYEGGSALSSATVQITQHTGSDSDQWLLHEVERDFRNYYGIPGVTYGPREIDGQTILEDTVGGVVYRWLSGNKVINIKYVDLEMTKPEPIEVVKAYLAKHPSTLQSFTLAQLRSSDSKTTWIKDEMERMLWLGDKWFMALETGKAEQREVLKKSVKHMERFLLYRYKYFGVDGLTDAKALRSYLSENNEAGIKAKLEEYKTWWAGNKDKAINL